MGKIAMAESLNRYRSTASKFKGGAQEMYVAYEMMRSTRSGSTIMPKVKRVYIAGEVKHWQIGDVKKRSGRQVHGVVIEYEQARAGYNRTGYSAQRGATNYQVNPARVGGSSQKFTQVVEIPETAGKINFYKDAAKLPAKYKSALQNIR
jgi:hypothetical protein